jgi:hypothetical protein
MIGAITGDIIGSVYERNNIKTKAFHIFAHNAHFTDDTVLTVALADSILTGTPYAENLRCFYHWYPWAGYGGSFHRWANDTQAGPYNSWGNGVRTPLQVYIDQLDSSRNQQSTLHSLYVFCAVGNKQATTALLDFFEHLGPPRTLKAVHFKVDMLERMATCNTPRFLELLLADLEATPSNNTTRQWITAIIKHLRRFPNEAVEDRLRDMIRRNVFSYRLRRSIEDMLDDTWD